MAGAVMMGVQVLDMAANHLDGAIGELANYAMKPLVMFNASVFRIFSNPAFQSGWRNKAPPKQAPPPEFNPFVDEATQFSNYWNDTQIALTKRLRIEAEQSLRDRLNFRLQILQERRQTLTESRTMRDIRKHNAQIALTQPQLQEYQKKIDEVIKYVDDNIEIAQKHINEADKDIAEYKQSLEKPVYIPQEPKNEPIPKVQLLEPEPVQLLEEYDPQLFNKSPIIITPFDNIASFFGKKNVSIFQFGVDGGLKINISPKGIISVVDPGSGYVTGIANTAGGTRFKLVVNNPNIIPQPQYEPQLIEKPIKVSKPKPEPKLKNDPKLKPEPVIVPKPEQPKITRRG